MATGNVMRGELNRERAGLEARVVWIDARVRAHDAQRHTHAQSIDHLEARKVEFLREIGKQDTLQAVATKRCRTEASRQWVVRDEEEADECLACAR